VRTVLKRWYRLAMLAPLVFLTSCAKDAPQDIFQPEGKYARKIDHLQRPIFYIAGVVFVLVEALIVIAIIKYRQRPSDDEDALPEQLHGNFKLEIGWTILPALILAVVRSRQHQAVGLAQDLEPFADPRGEQGMVEEYPGLVEHQKGRPAVEPLFQPVEEISQHGRHHAGLAHQRLGLEALDIGEGEMLLGRVEQSPIGTVERVGAKRGTKGIRLEEQG